MDDRSSDQHLPEEMREKFKVEENGRLVQSSETEPTPASDVAPSKGKKRATTAVKPQQLAAAKEPAFKYIDRRPKIDPLWVGESQVFDVTYFGMVAGTIKMEVLPFKVVQNRKVYHLRGSAISSEVFKVFYWLKDTAESYWDYEGLFSHRFRLLLDEKKQRRDALELYDSEKKRTFYWDRWDRFEKGFHEKKEYGDIEPFPQDHFSAIYFVRTLPLENGQSYRFPLVSEGKTYEIIATADRRETMKTPLGNVPVVVVKVDTKFEGVIKKQGDIWAWYTDDDRRFLVRVEAKVRIGSVVAKLSEVKLGDPP